MKKAIVFAGGGSKGAYQVGAWKALNELGEKILELHIARSRKEKLGFAIAPIRKMRPILDQYG